MVRGSKSTKASTFKPSFLVQVSQISLNKVLLALWAILRVGMGQGACWLKLWY